MVSFQAQSLPVLQFKGGRNWCPSSRQSGRSFPFLVEGSTFSVLFKLLTDWRGSPPQIKTIPLLSLLILMLISPWNTLIDTPRRLLDQISEFLEAQSSQCIKWTITKTFHLFPWFAQIYWEDSFLITICWIPTDIHELLLYAGVYFFFPALNFGHSEQAFIFSSYRFFREKDQSFIFSFERKKIIWRNTGQWAICFVQQNVPTLWAYQNIFSYKYWGCYSWDPDLDENLQWKIFLYNHCV